MEEVYNLSLIWKVTAYDEQRICLVKFFHSFLVKNEIFSSNRSIIDDESVDFNVKKARDQKDLIENRQSSNTEDIMALNQRNFK